MSSRKINVHTYKRGLHISDLAGSRRRHHACIFGDSNTYIGFTIYCNRILPIEMVRF